MQSDTVVVFITATVISKKAASIIAIIGQKILHW